MKKYMQAAIYNDPNEVKEEATETAEQPADENLGAEAAATTEETASEE